MSSPTIRNTVIPGFNPDPSFLRGGEDYGQGLHFTGAMVAITFHDVGGTNAVADFDYFEMRQLFSEGEVE